MKHAAAKIGGGARGGKHFHRMGGEMEIRSKGVIRQGDYFPRDRNHPNWRSRKGLKGGVGN